MQVNPALCRCSAATAGATSTSSTIRTSRCRPAATATRSPTLATSSSRSERPIRRRRRRCSKCASGGRAPRAARIRRRLAPPARSTRTESAGLPSDPRVVGGLPTQIITGFSDLGRQATNPQWQYPEVYNPKVNYTWLAGRHSLKTGYELQYIQTEVQDVNPLYGRDEYSGSVQSPRRRHGGELAIQPRRLHVRGAQPLRAQQHLHRQPAAEHAFHLSAGRLARQRSADAQPRAALRVRDAVGREGQHPVELRSGDAHHDLRARRLAPGPIDAEA